jgi:hypothetical protein
MKDEMAKKTLSSLDKKLWKIFSIYIRKRDSDEDGYVYCFTCGVRKHWTEVDAGHFVTRSAKAIKYDEKNVHAQCKACNGFQGGMTYEYGKKLDERYGKGTAENLEAQRHSISGWTIQYLEDLIEKYNKKEG